MRKIIFLSLLTISTFFYAQSKYFNTFTLVNDGNGTSMKDDVLITMREGYLNMTSNYFKFNNAKKTGRNEMYHDSKKGDMIVSQYLTNYYDIALIRYVEYPDEIYLKILEKNDGTNYLIHLHNK